MGRDWGRGAATGYWGEKWQPESVEDDQDNKGAAQVCARQLPSRQQENSTYAVFTYSRHVLRSRCPQPRTSAIRNVDRLTEQSIRPLQMLGCLQVVLPLLLAEG